MPYSIRKLSVYLLSLALILPGLINFNAFAARRSDMKRERTRNANATAAPSTQGERVNSEIDEATRRQVVEAVNQMPLRFEANSGQTDSRVHYLSRGQGYMLFLTPTEAVLSLRRGSKDKAQDKALSHSAQTKRVRSEKMSVVRMRLVGANQQAEMKGEQQLKTPTNYFIGDDKSKWHAATNYERVRAESVYPGIDMLYYGKQQELEYDFEVSPNADPRVITMQFKGVSKLRIDEQGELVLKVRGGGEVRQHKPVTYQVIDGERREVESRYVLKGKNRVGFKVGEYDGSERLVIDPVLSYSTYLGGDSGDQSNSIAVDSSGNAYVAGYTFSTDFPTLNQYQTAQAGNDAFITKLNTNASGNSSLLYSTYLGGSSDDYGQSIAVDSSGNAYVSGYTGSTDFPTLNQYQTNAETDNSTATDAFVIKLNTNVSGNSSLLYSTYLGGSSDDIGVGIAIDSSGDAYVTGYTESANFPTQNQYQTDQAGTDAFVTKIRFILPAVADFDGDGLTDPSIWSPNNTNWYFIDSTTNTLRVHYNWGAGFLGDVAVPRDYDGDGETDIAVWRPSEGNWYIVNSATNTVTVKGWGAGSFGDRPVPADYDADGKADLAVWRPSEGNWYILNSADNSVTTKSWGAGSFGDKPVVGDYDGDGQADIAVWRPGEGNWYIIKSSDSSVTTKSWGAGSLGDRPVQSDYDGDGKTDIAVWRGSEGNWYIINSADNSVTVRSWGASSLNDVPVPGDYDGDGKADIAVWRPAEGNWYIIQSQTDTVKMVGLGTTGDVPAPSTYIP